MKVGDKVTSRVFDGTRTVVYIGRDYVVTVSDSPDSMPLVDKLTEVTVYKKPVAVGDRVKDEGGDTGLVVAMHRGQVCVQYDDFGNYGFMSPRVETLEVI